MIIIEALSFVQNSIKIQLLEDEFKLAIEKLKQNPNHAEFEQLRVSWLGKKSHLAKLYESLRELSKADRPKVGNDLNILKKKIEKQIQLVKESVIQYELEKNLQRPALDVSLPVLSGYECGALHPITLVRRMMNSIFQRHGFVVYDGPELELEDYNFSGLNIPKDHPSRDMQDTFFIKNDAHLVLRTHTSNVQLHTMVREKPPLRFISPGKVYRVDNDATHSPMFHQIECVVVDKHITFAHLKGMIRSFLNDIFGSKVTTRFRPSYFPFVEPGAEIDIMGPKGWMEIGGCGMIHPNVFEFVNYDSEVYTGYAFGFGLDRMAMLLYGLKDLRQLFEGDVHYHNQFPIHK